MKPLLILLTITICSFDTAWSQSYDASLIPEDIRTGANFVKRFEENSFEVTDVDRAKQKIHQVYTLLNKNAESMLTFARVTNKFISLGDFQIRCLDASGKEQLRYKKKDLIKQARYAEVVEEGMYHYLTMATASYPVTLDISYEINYTGTLIYPSYQIQGPDEGVEQSSYTVKIPKELGIRFREQNTKLKPVISEESGNLIYKWNVNNLKPFKYEYGSVEEGNYCPSILFAPNKFRIYNTGGEMTSWKAFGEWEQNLCKDLESLPDDRKAFFQNMVKDAKDDREKVALVYQYLQDNFRYVSIQLGIGGFKPFPAKFTDDKKYGDCKGLSFYMHSVLLALGIKSYVALVNADYNNPPLDISFPVNKFNHMILCVPQRKDTIWLECTSNSTEFNYLGSFTENRNALLITEDGGVLVSTPKSVAANDRMSVTTYINLNEDGSGSTRSQMQTRGYFNEMIRQVESSNKEGQKELIIRTLGFKQPDEFSVVGRKKLTENTQIDLNIEKIPQFTAGNKMFLNPRIYTLLAGKMPEYEKRNFDYYFPNCFDKTDTTVYHLPEGYTADALPVAMNKSDDFASYTTSYTFNKDRNELISSAHLVLKQNRIPADKYAEVKSFFDQVRSDDAQKLVIRKD